MKLDDVISVREAATILNLGIARVTELCRAGELPARRLEIGWILSGPTIRRIGRARRKWARAPKD